MEKDLIKNLVSELENISKDECIVMHILDFGFLSKESRILSNLFTSLNDKSDEGLILFKEDQSNLLSVTSSDSLINIQRSPLHSSDNNKEFVLTLLIGNKNINDISSNFGSYTYKDLSGNCNSSQTADLDSYVISSNFTKTNLKNILQNELFKGIEVEVTINANYPKSPLNLYYLSYYNLNKFSRDLIKCSIENYIKNNKELCLSNLLLIIKEKLRNLTEEFTENSTSKNFYKDFHEQNVTKINSINDELEKMTSNQLEELENDSYNLSHGRLEDNFEIMKVLGYGGFGSVFMAREKFGGRCVYAIKQILLSSRNIHENQLLINEAAMLACLNHEKIVRYYHAWVQESIDGRTRYINNELLNRNICSSFAPELLSQFSAITAQYISDENSVLKPDISEKKFGYSDRKKLIYLYIQMEYCSGYSLQFAIDQGLLFNNQKLIWHIFYQIIQGLSYLHAKGVIHRDLKPSNIFLQLDENNFTNEKENDNWFMVKLGDFGLTTFVNIFQDISYNNELGFRTNKELSSGVGTIFYMAPEQCKGNNYNQSVDMFSLGVILFEMYHPPFKTGMERVQILTQLTKYTVIPENCNIPNKVQILIKSLLSNDPKERPTSHQLLYNEWILKQMKFNFEGENDINFKNRDTENNSREYSSLKICDLISRSPHIHENVQILSTLFSIEKRFLDRLNCRTENHFSYLFRMNMIGYRDIPLQNNNLLSNYHHYYRRRSELIASIKSIFKIHGATEIEIPILIPKNNNKNITLDENIQYEINDNDNNISIEHDYFLTCTNERNQNNSQLKGKKNKKNMNKKSCQSSKLSTEINNNITGSDNPLTVLLLDRTGTPLILCNNILKNMSAQFGDGQSLRAGAVIKRFYIDSIYTQENFVSVESSNNKGKVAHAHPKEILLGAYEIVVKINDSIGEEFDEGLNFAEFSNNQFRNINLNILPIWYYNIVVYYDIEVIITALDTLKPYEFYLGQPILVWGDSQLFTTLLESWLGVKYDKAKHLQLWLQNMIPKGFSKRKFFNILQKITLISLVDYANCYGFDREVEETNSLKFEIHDGIVKYYIGLKILSYPTILEKVVEYILYIINEFKGSIKEFINLINEKTLEIYNLFEIERKKFIAICKNDNYKRMAHFTKYPLYLNLTNNNVNSSNNSNLKNIEKSKDNRLLTHEIEIDFEYITPNLFKVLYRISLFEKLLNYNNLEIINIFFDPMLFSSNNFFESGFFFYIFSSEISCDQNTNTSSSNNQNLTELFKSNLVNKSLCKVGCIMDLIYEGKQNISNLSSPQILLKKTSIELLVKGGRFDNWYTNAYNNKSIIFYKKVNKSLDKISAVGFEIVLERILLKLLYNPRFRKIYSSLSSNQMNTQNLCSIAGVHVFIYNSNTKYQIKAFKLKQILLSKGIKCLRNNSCNNGDFSKIRTHLKSIITSLHWIVHIIKGNLSDNRKHSISASINKSTLIPLINDNNFIPNNFDNQNCPYLSSESKYKLEWCLGTDHCLTSYARELICNYSNSTNLSNLEITFETETSTVQFFMDFYSFNN